MNANLPPGSHEPLAGIEEPTPRFLGLEEHAQQLGAHVVKEWKDSLKSLLDETMDKFEVMKLARKPVGYLEEHQLVSVTDNFLGT